VQPVGIAHTAFAAASMALGLGVLLRPKGTEFHRSIGMLYVLSMFGLNVTALSIYRVFGGLGVFHVLSIASLVSVLAGFMVAFLRRPRHAWLSYHYYSMGWSYVGLCAAAGAELAVRVPGVPFGLGVAVPTIGIAMLGGALVRIRSSATIARAQQGRGAA
jgi:uncharacterized membrane protein